MAYDARFLYAKNLRGKLYRDEKTGNLIEYCGHIFVVYPRFGVESDSHAKFIPLERKTFEGFEGTCQSCGDILFVSAVDVVKDYEAANKVLESALKEMNKVEVSK